MPARTPVGHPGAIFYDDEFAPFYKSILHTFPVPKLPGVLSIPPAFWQWAFIGTFAKSPHAGDLMVYAAAEGDVRTVLGYLEHGVRVAATNYEGSTAAFTAAVGGSLPVIKMLVSKGADLNTVNSWDSPLEAAVKTGHTDVSAFLKAHGALSRSSALQKDHTVFLVINTTAKTNDLYQMVLHPPVELHRFTGTPRQRQTAT